MELILLTYGIFKIDESERIKVFSDQVPKGYLYHYPNSALLITKTSKIPLSINTGFGLNFILNNSEDIEQTLLIKIIHPEIENPERLIFTETSYSINLGSDIPNTEVHIFEEKWEMIPGFWTFQVWNKNFLLVEKEFEVYSNKDLEDVEENFFYDMN